MKSELKDMKSDPASEKAPKQHPSPREAGESPKPLKNGRNGNAHANDVDRLETEGPSRTPFFESYKKSPAAMKAAEADVSRSETQAKKRGTR